MNDLINRAPELIREAAKSARGLLALVVVVLAILALAFFTTASESTRAAIFVLIFAGTALFVISVLRLAAVEKTQPDGPPVPSGIREQIRQDVEAQLNRAKSLASTQEQIGLLQEISKKLDGAITLAVEAQWSLMGCDLFSQVIRDDQSLSEQIRAIMGDFSNKFLDDYTAKSEQWPKISNEINQLGIRSRVYFGEETAQALMEFGNAFLQSIRPRVEFTEIANELSGVIRDSIKSETSTNQLLAEMTRHALPRMAPVFGEVRQARSRVVESIVKHLQNAA